MDSPPMDLPHLKQLPARARALICIGLLLDGRDASTFLASDAVLGERLAAAATKFSTLEADLRMPFLGTLLREALEELAKGKQK